MSRRSLWFEAAALAARAHAGQRRRDGQTPYAAHPTRVALWLAAACGERDEAILAAALLHDVIEDRDVDFDEIEERVGVEVARLVATLTKDKRLVESEREAAYDAQLAAGPSAARLIKLADVYDNLLDAEGVSARRLFIEKAERALTLAAGDERLATAATLLRDLVERVTAEAGQRR
ncbi:MAG: HD domain-containing protein [Phycisphaerae bacterium]|nr:HD domain-containing protein [Phycisphaerae bacterium]